MSKLIRDSSDNRFYWILLAISVVIGTLIRFKGLGNWPLALDEYYIIKSSEYILEHGLPQFPNDGYYIRGILMQYLIAPLLHLGVKAELSGRLITVIANLITIPAVYMIAKKVGNQLLATIVVVIFSLSVWEIEFARFARMYTPFQAIFMWYIYFALTDFLNNSFRNYKWMLLLSFISFLVYEGSIFLAVFNFVPFVLQRKVKVVYLLGAIGTFFGSAFFNMFDFRTLNSNPILPPKYIDSIVSNLSSTPIKLPKILLFFSFDTVLSTLFVILLVAANIYLFFKILQLFKKRNFWTIISILVLSVLAIFNQFGLFLLTFFCLAFWDILDIKFNKRKIIFMLAGIFILNFMYWLAFGVLSNNWYSLFTDFSSYNILGVTKRLLVGFLNYPDNYYSVYNYLSTLPFLTIVSILFSVPLFIFSIVNKDEKKEINFLMASLIFVSLLATIPTLLYEETRYTFFAAPLLMIMVTYSIYFFSNMLLKNKPAYVTFVFITISLSTFVYSKDFNFYHLTHIDSEDVNYRMIYNNKLKKHLYRRWDIKTPIEYVKKNMSENDIIIINENSPEYYLPKVDFYNFDYTHKAFIALSVEEGSKERWSNTNLINNNIDLINIIESRKATIWFLVFPEAYLRQTNFLKKYKNSLVYKGVDDMISVYKFPFEK